MPRPVDAYLLHAFLTACEMRTVSRAAERLARTQAAVSMQLKRLEADLGATLLVRSPRGIAPTEAGEIVLAYARKMAALGEEARRQLARQELQGRVRLGMLEDLAIGRLPSLLADFRQRHPRVEIDLFASDSTELGLGFKQQRFDVVIADPARVAAVPVLHWSRELVWAASRMLDAHEDEPLPLVLFEGSCSWQDRMITLLAEANRAWRVGSRSTTFAALLAALRAGLGVALLLPENVPVDCEVVDVALTLPPAPKADFGLFIAKSTTKIGEELGAFLRRALVL
jgi:DNA-binding transcriptional LysR family regulator